MLREIGSNFWISPGEGSGGRPLSDPSVFQCPGTDSVWLSTGRSATRLVLETVLKRNPAARRIALVPSFTCHTVIEPFLCSGYNVVPIPVHVTELSVSAETILSLQQQTGAGVVLFHHYFGFPTLDDPKRVVEVLNRRGVIVIEDRTQCLYSGFGVSGADYYVGSIRKWCGVPDGGFAVCREGSFPDKPVDPDGPMVEKKREAAALKYKYIFAGEGEKRVFKDLYREAESMLDSQEGYYTISPLSSRIQAGLDVGSLVERRRRNYLHLLNALAGSPGLTPVFAGLPESVAPLYFPLYSEDRSRLQSLLADQDIYAPVVWPKADCCPPVDAEAEFVYQHILCIPIDQRYGDDDMDRICRVVRNEN